MAEVVTAQPALDVRDGQAQRTAEQCSEHSGHRVTVTEHEGFARAGLEALAQRPAAPNVRSRDCPKPARNVPVDPEVVAARSPAEPDVRLPQSELLEERRDLLDLLARR